MCCGVYASYHLPNTDNITKENIIITSAGSLYSRVRCKGLCKRYETHNLKLNVDYSNDKRNPDKKPIKKCSTCSGHTVFTDNVMCPCCKQRYKTKTKNKDAIKNKIKRIE